MNCLNGSIFEELKKQEPFRTLLSEFESEPEKLKDEIHKLAQKFLHQDKVDTAWKILLTIE